MAAGVLRSDSLASVKLRAYRWVFAATLTLVDALAVGI